ncbi:universal stress protein [Oceanidesulfovibrio marinus]|uniref:Universal stress protein n=1 Tax=Oceanidesulfovibrio marinus TaxID=370038 RepID=A0A6P1ZFF9_9BACT|nr:universal stress protein [Oceanidesulfovibrio marinus]QJT07925.1 universal stress protein [Oceanidesulfovibrio marinus]TVM33424.1 universal stress protein [Oceanidesulfovibrio marinus]
MFKDIVVGVTPSGVDECAVNAAVGFAKRFDAKLYLVHVAGAAQGWGEIRYLEGSGETGRLREQIQEYYGPRLQDLEHFEIMVVPGMPHAELLRTARKVNSDLIVLGPHTKEHAERRSRMWGMTGSTLERVSQRARCPVMIVSRPLCDVETNFLRVVVATDFSDQADCAVNYGGQMARQYKSALTMFHALDIEGISGQLDQQEVELRITDIKKRLKEEYEHRLRGIAECEYECWEGKPSMEILKLARMKEADIIIMAHHSKETDPEKAFLGSTVTQVSLNSACPTMSVNKHFDMRCGLMYDQTGAVTSEEHEAPADA